MKQNPAFSLISLLIAGGLLLGGFFMYRSHMKHNPSNTQPSQAIDPHIQPYDDTRDREFILDFIKRNWYWLLSDFTTFDPVYMLDHMAPYMSSIYWNDLTLKVYRENGKTVAFTTWYFKEPGLARLQFLGVSPEMRGKGIGRKLVQHAIAAMKKSGAKTILILARLNNAPARNLYTSLGFTEYKITEDKYVDHRMTVG